MYTCPSCGGYLRFDIESQEMKCDSCGNTLNVPDESEQNMEAEYTAKIYTCPQCGGELVGDDNEAVVFCSFCGSSNVLKERYEKEKRPEKIIPFQITKEQCKEIYKNKLKSAPFAPRELKDPKFIDSFRGIYMPFYLYDADVDNNFSLAGESVQHGLTSDTVTSYIFSGNVKGKFENIPHDASKSFADDISESIVPFNDDEAKAFSTGYMAGFYADTADVDANIYVEDVNKVAKAGAARAIEIDPNVAGINLVSKPRTAINPKVNEPKIGLFPIWFFSYRNRDRIAYAAINGQTGKVSMDIPVDMKKYFLYSILMAIPIFAVLNFIATLTPATMMMVALVFDIIAGVLTLITNKNLKATLSGATDRGLSGGVKKKSKGNAPNIAFVALLIVAILVSATIWMGDPVADIPYYLASLFSIVAVAVTMAYQAGIYNKISTRPLPQFKRKGGNDNA